MPPVPCAHCAMNFMRSNLDAETPNLCNNCIEREKLRNPKKETKMQTQDTIDIVVTLPRKEFVLIEEHCVNEGQTYNDYFLNLHKLRKPLLDELPTMDHSVNIEQESEKKSKKGTRR